MGTKLQRLSTLFPPNVLLILGYFALLSIGLILLLLPFSTRGDSATIDILFVATSALSTTGLSTMDIGVEFTGFGQAIILLLIQVGGLGYMSIGSFVVLMRFRRISSESETLIKSDFSLPENFKVIQFIRSLIFFTLSIELLGAILLFFIFQSAGDANPVWNAVFHSISAFCTAGFSLFSSGLEGYVGNIYLNIVISFLALSGAIGFIVFTDLYERVTGAKKSITFTTRIILRFTATGILGGAALLFLSSSNLSELPDFTRLQVAFFQSMTAFTTVGFNTVSIGEFSPAPLFLLLLMMIVGASPSGTGGGIKSTTFTALFAQLRATFKGDTQVTFLGRRIPGHRVRMAVSNFFFYMIVVSIGIFLLLLVQPQPIFEVIFEAISALGTVGISTGLTGDLCVIGKLVVIVLMFLGRIGPLTFGLVLFGKSGTLTDPEEEDIAI